jgi:hypothetical protein
MPKQSKGRGGNQREPLKADTRAADFREGCPSAGIAASKGYGDV